MDSQTYDTTTVTVKILLFAWIVTISFHVPNSHTIANFFSHPYTFCLSVSLFSDRYEKQSLRPTLLLVLLTITAGSSITALIVASPILLLMLFTDLVNEDTVCLVHHTEVEWPLLHNILPRPASKLVNNN